MKERRDVLSWVNYALERFGPDQKIVLYGISMGAATVLMSVGLGLPGAVRGIVADCPYSSPAEIIDIVERRMKIPRPLRLPFAELSARLFGNFSLYAASAAEAVSHNERVPILLIHGEEDTLVPAALSKKIAESDPEHIRYLTVPGAEHGVSFLVDRPRYCKEVLAFSREVTEENEKTTESSE